MTRCAVVGDVWLMVGSIVTESDVEGLISVKFEELVTEKIVPCTIGALEAFLPDTEAVIALPFKFKDNSREGSAMGTWKKTQ